MGSEVGLHYDSLLGKLIAWGETRDRAIRRMERALSELVIVGVLTSQPFHRRVMADASFRAGDYDIDYLERVGSTVLRVEPTDEELHLAAIAAVLAEEEARRVAAPHANGPTPHHESAWLRAARLAALR